MTEVSLAKTPRARTAGGKFAAAAPDKDKPGVPMTPDSILGVLARDCASGLTGVVIAKCEQMNGNVQFGLQPKGEADKLADAHFFDYHLLEEVGPGLSARAEKPAVPSVAIGEVARDKVSGYQGTVVEKFTFLNGCVHLAVQATKRRQNIFGEIPNALRFSHDRLAKVEPLGQRIARALRPAPKPLLLTQKVEIKASEPEKTIEAIKKSPRPPGGPSRSMSSLRSSVR